MKQRNEDVEKQTFNTYRVIASIVLTILTIVIFFWEYVAAIPIVVLMFFTFLTTIITNIPLLSIVIILLVDIRSLYTYIKYALDCFSNKKILKGLILAVILIAVVTLFRIQEQIMNHKFVVLTYSILLVTCAIIIPIVRGILDLVKIWKKYKQGKEKKVHAIIMTIVIVIVLGVTQFFMGLYSYFVIANEISQLKNSSFSEIFKPKEIKAKEDIMLNVVENPHISEAQRNSNISFAPNSKLKEEWITSERKYNAGQKSAMNFTFKNKINLDNNGDNEVSYMKLCFQLNEDLTNYIPVEENEEYYNKIDSYLIASTVMEITLKPGVELKNKYYTLKLNRYDENFNIKANCSYIFEPVAEIGVDSEGRQVIYVKYNDYYNLGGLNNIEFILGKE